jgi:hypothetical protein
MVVNFECRGYQRVGENITKGVPDMHEAIDVSHTLHYNHMIHDYIHGVSCLVNDINDVVHRFVCYIMHVNNENIFVPKKKNINKNTVGTCCDRVHDYHIKLALTVGPKSINGLVKTFKFVKLYYWGFNLDSTRVHDPISLCLQSTQ